MDWTSIIILSFASLIVYTVVNNTRNKTLDPWQCSRCLRHNNTKVKCDLCNAPFNWKVGDVVPEDEQG
jgi:hypothetical protein